MKRAPRPIFLAALLLCGCFGGEHPSLKSKDPALKIPAIKMAVDDHDLAACAELVKDLDSDDPAVRFYAVEGLRKLTGETFGYRYYDDEIRAEAGDREMEGLAGIAGNHATPGEPTGGIHESGVIARDRSRRMARSSQQITTQAANAARRPTPRERVELRFLSDPANLAPAREAVEKLALAGGMDATATGEIGLVVNEALANVMRHAYGGATDRPIELHAWWQDDALAITVRDWGNGVNPLEDLPEKKHNPLKPGGLGLICLKKLMDEVDFSPQPDGMLLTMKRNRKAVVGH